MRVERSAKVKAHLPKGGRNREEVILYLRRLITYNFKLEVKRSLSNTGGQNE